MNGAGQSRVVGLLGVGFDHEDEHIRITRADNYQVLMGSHASHKKRQEMCSKIDKMIRSSGRLLSDYTPEEFMELVGKLY